MFWIPYLSDLDLFISILAGTLIGFGIWNLYLALLVKPKLDEMNTRLYLVQTWLFFLGFLFMVVCVAGIILKTPIVLYAYDLFNNLVPDGITVNQIIMICPIVACIFGILGLFNLGIALGLVKENERSRKIAVIFHSLFAFTLIGLIIGCFLSENSIKTQFNK